MSTLDKLNSYVGHAYNKDSFHCYTYLEKCMDVPILSDVHVETAKGDVDKYIDFFTELDTPENYCIALLGESHIGAYYNGGVFHADKPMVRYESMRVIKMKYKNVRYFKIRDKTI